jgi:hypothetical protein
VQQQPADPCDAGAPQPHGRLLGVVEVVGAGDPGDPLLRPDRHQPAPWDAGHQQVRGVDHGDRRRHLSVERQVAGVDVQLALHRRDVGVGQLDDEPGRGAGAAGVAEMAVDDHGSVAGEVVVLEPGEAGGRLAADRPAGRVLAVGDHHGGGGRPLGHPGPDVHAAEAGRPGRRHALGERAQLSPGRPVRVPVV